MTIVTKDAGSIACIKKEIMSKFDISDLGELTKIVGCEVQRNRKSNYMLITQSQYVHWVLTLFSMENCKSTDTPLNPGIWLQQQDEEELDHELCK